MDRGSEGRWNEEKEGGRGEEIYQYVGSNDSGVDLQ